MMSCAALPGGNIVVETFATSSSRAWENETRPNVVFFLADDLGWRDLSVEGSTFYESPNIDRIANEGGMFTDSYAQQSCTAGRASFILGQHPFRTGLLAIGMPGSDHGIPDFAPTMADLLKERGFTILRQFDSWGGNGQYNLNLHNAYRSITLCCCIYSWVYPLK